MPKIPIEIGPLKESTDESEKRMGYKATGNKSLSGIETSDESVEEETVIGYTTAHILVDLAP